MGLFIVLTLAMVIGFFVLNFSLAKGPTAADTIPDGPRASYEEIDWDSLKVIEGYGALIDSNGKILKSFNKDLSGTIDLFQALGYSNYASSDTTIFTYDSGEDQKLILFFPKTHIGIDPAIKVNSYIPGGSMTVGAIALLFLGLYILLTYLLIRRLGKFFQREQKREYMEELEEKDRLFRGLGHDMKTPLSAIIGYNQAMKEGLVPEDQRILYHEKIQKSAYTLKTRLDGLMSFAALGSQPTAKMEKGDILEATRRYLGENYSYFKENGLTVNILFPDDQSFETVFDRDLYFRLLQNILQNSIDHQEVPLESNISFKDKTLIIKDTGVEIPEEMWDQIFEPMVTGDASRSGEKNRGLGLANVKRICRIHHWEVAYNHQGFQIKFS